EIEKSFTAWTTGLERNEKPYPECKICSKAGPFSTASENTQTLAILRISTQYHKSFLIMNYT
ncbi:MAG: hypothetical protein P8X85_24865, partial [Desulfobacterales bacterium]